MSQVTNDKLFDEAREMSEFWTGTMHQAIIDDLYKKKDLEGLAQAVRSAQQDAYDLQEPDESPDEVGDIF